MSTFFRYLLALAMNLAWQRAGRGGAIPPVRLPGKGKAPLPLPMIGPWQLMAATWVLKRVWGKYGSQIKSRLQNNANDLTRRAAQYIPDPKLAGAVSGAATSTSSTRSTPTVTPTPTPRATPNFDTQVLGGTPQNPSTTNASTTNTSQNPLPQGSILGKLRGRS